MDRLGRPDAADREQARRKEGPEKGGEEHHLGGDQTGGDRADERPDARSDKMIGVLRRGVRFTHGFKALVISLQNATAMEALRRQSRAPARATGTSCKRA